MSIYFCSYIYVCHYVLLFRHSRATKGCVRLQAGGTGRLLPGAALSHSSCLLYHSRHIPTVTGGAADFKTAPGQLRLVAALACKFSQPLYHSLRSTPLDPT
jgi:hypothetical protein